MDGWWSKEDNYDESIVVERERERDAGIVSLVVDDDVELGEGAELVVIGQLET